MSDSRSISTLSRLFTRDYFYNTKRISADDPTAPLLCKKCRKYDFLVPSSTAFDQRTAWHPDEVFNDASLTVRKGSVSSLSTTAQTCRFCKLILAAVAEQLQLYDKRVVCPNTKEYAVQWRYVPRDLDYVQNYKTYLGYLQVLFPGWIWPRLKSSPNYKNPSVKSFIVPVCVDGKTLMKARRLRDQTDFSLLRKQIDCCDKWHAESCRGVSRIEEGGFSTRHLILIDVAHMCLMVPSEPIEYVALSYVWGSHGENSLLTTVDIVGELKVAGALTNRWEEIPATIQDAIRVVQALGKRYLWVDSLCIVYAGASLTIIAATGTHANSGLPGVQQGSRRRAQRLATPATELELALLDDVEFLFNTSLWMTWGLDVGSLVSEKGLDFWHREIPVVFFVMPPHLKRDSARRINIYFPIP
ncbi:hypothetical protein QBC44DRAFT_393733 [Cladorrhinum sp. PSN332]|nr:hypothetical protein QBC44DRAFT_393733 [Cladorrhinum sp. PSN332]